MTAGLLLLSLLIGSYRLGSASPYPPERHGHHMEPLVSLHHLSPAVHRIPAPVPKPSEHVNHLVLQEGFRRVEVTGDTSDACATCAKQMAAGTEGTSHYDSHAEHGKATHKELVQDDHGPPETQSPHLLPPKEEAPDVITKLPLDSAPVTEVPSSITGGFQHMTNVNDILKVAMKAVKLLQKLVSGEMILILREVYRAEVQVVAGLKHRLMIEVEMIHCKEHDSSNCKSDPRSKVRVFLFEMHEDVHHNAKLTSLYEVPPDQVKKLPGLLHGSTHAEEELSAVAPDPTKNNTVVNEPSEKSQTHLPQHSPSEPPLDVQEISTPEYKELVQDDHRPPESQPPHLLPPKEEAPDVIKKLPLDSAPVTEVPSSITGGFQHMTKVNDILKVAMKAVKLLQKLVSGEMTLILREVYRAEVQVVAGLKYRLTIEVKMIHCKEHDSSNCKSDPRSKVRVFLFEMHQDVNHNTKLTSLHEVPSDQVKGLPGLLHGSTHAEEEMSTGTFVPMKNNTAVNELLEKSLTHFSQNFPGRLPLHVHKTSTPEYKVVPSGTFYRMKMFFNMSHCSTHSCTDKEEVSHGNEVTFFQDHRGNVIVTAVGPELVQDDHGPPESQSSHHLPPKEEAPDVITKLPLDSAPVTEVPSSITGGFQHMTNVKDILKVAMKAVKLLQKLVSGEMTLILREVYRAEVQVVAGLKHRLTIEVEMIHCKEHDSSKCKSDPRSKVRVFLFEMHQDVNHNTKLTSLYEVPIHQVKKLPGLLHGSTHAEEELSAVASDPMKNNPAVNEPSEKSPTHLPQYSPSEPPLDVQEISTPEHKEVAEEVHEPPESQSPHLSPKEESPDVVTKLSLDSAPTTKIPLLSVGFQPMTNTNDILKAASKAVETLETNVQDTLGLNIVLLEVYRAEVQVAAGLNYRLTIKVEMTRCQGHTRHNAHCISSIGKKLRVFFLEMHEDLDHNVKITSLHQVLEPFKTPPLLSVQKQNGEYGIGTSHHEILTAFHPLTNKSDIQEAATEAARLLQEHFHRDLIIRVKEVYRASVQIVDGVNYRLLIKVSFTNCTTHSGGVSCEVGSNAVNLIYFINMHKDTHHHFKLTSFSHAKPEDVRGLHPVYSAGGCTLTKLLKKRASDRTQQKKIPEAVLMDTTNNKANPYRHAA